MHTILERQIKKFFPAEKIPKEWMPFLNAVSSTYADFDRDRELLDRSLEISSKEFAENTHLLEEAKRNVEKKVFERTAELEFEKEKVENANFQINEKNEALKSALAVKNDFMRIASHQLNTPIAIMKNAYEMIKDGSLEFKEGVDYIGSGLNRLVAVFEDIKTVLRFEEKDQYDIQKNDLNSIISEVVEYAKKTIKIVKKDITIIVENANFKIPEVLCDLKQVNNAIYNLLDNAVYYTQKGEIKIKYELLNENYVKVSIQDSGIGFSKEESENLGQKFYRAKKALLVRPDGSGLGLYICKNIIEKNAGEFSFFSPGIGKGSTFSFTLPIAK